jgi:hypothetical protein
MALEGVVWKFEFQVADAVTVMTPEVVAVMGIGTQREGYICVWLLVRPETESRETTFYVRGTGHPVPLDLTPIGIVFDGPFVWHVFR